MQLLGAVRTRRSGQLPGTPAAAPLLPGRRAPTLPSEQDPHGADTAGEQQTISAKETPPAQSSDTRVASAQPGAAIDRRRSPTQHAAAHNSEGSGKLPPLPDPPNVLELVIAMRCSGVACAVIANRRHTTTTHADRAVLSQRSAIKKLLCMRMFG